MNHGAAFRLSVSLILVGVAVSVAGFVFLALREEALGSMFLPGIAMAAAGSVVAFLDQKGRFDEPVPSSPLCSDADGPCDGCPSSAEGDQGADAPGAEEGAADAFDGDGSGADD